MHGLLIWKRGVGDLCMACSSVTSTVCTEVSHISRITKDYLELD